MASQDIVDRQLENRSKLVFSFRKSSGQGSIVRTLHFAENINVRESVSTNYSEYTPLGNNGSVFAYLGSKSRDLSVDFNITLQNIMNHTLIKPPVAKSLSKITKDSYFVKVLRSATDFGLKPNKEGIDKNIDKFAEDFLNNLIGDAADLNLVGAVKSAAEGVTEGPVAENRKLALYKIMFWVNLIRSSVMTNSMKPSLGPPLVSLVHGILYQNVPCIVTDYTISYDEKGGFDEVTLLPRILKISLKMKEIRLRGQEFDPSHPETRNMMPGYESFIENGFATFDPTNNVNNTKGGSTI